MSLRNRVALVTGGSRGIGRGIALRLAQDGARIAIAYRSNKAAAQESLRQMQTAGADCVAVETDITEPARAEQLIKTVGDRFGRLDILVNNVGMFTSDQPGPGTGSGFLCSLDGLPQTTCSSGIVYHGLAGTALSPRFHCIRVQAVSRFGVTSNPFDFYAGAWANTPSSGSGIGCSGGGEG